MNLQSNKHFIAKLDSKLSILDKESLREIYLNKMDQVSCMYLTEEALYYGCTNSEVYCMNIFSLAKTLVCTHNEKVSSLFVLDDFLVIGLYNGRILKYAIHTDEDDEGMGDRVFTLVEEYKHNTPITSLVADGEDIVVADMNNRLTLYPKKTRYDMGITQLGFKDYVFASEKNRLFCKTRQAFASLLETNTKIHEFRFNENGGVVFIRLFDKIQVYEFNTKELIKEIEVVVDAYVYCDRTNRIIGWSGKEVVIIEEVLEGDYEKMRGVKFDPSEIQVKTVGVEYEEFHETKKKMTDLNMLFNLKKKDETVKKVSREKINLKDLVKKENENNRESPKKVKGNRKRLVNFSDDEEVPKKKVEDKLRSLFEEEEDEKETLRTPVKRRNVVDFIEEEAVLDVFPITNKSSSLLYYNKDGFLVSIRSSKSNRVALKFHDSTLPGAEVDDHAFCSQGIFSGRIIVLFSQECVYFYNGNLKWSKNIQAKKVCVSDKFVVVFSKLIHVLDHTGNEVFNFFIRDVSSMSLFQNKLIVCGKFLTTVDLRDFTSEEVSLPGKATWSFIDDFSNIFYKIEDDIYFHHHGLSHQISKDVKYPLAVVNRNLIALKSPEHLLPSPHIDFIKINNDYLNCSTKERKRRVSYEKIAKDLNKKMGINENSNKEIISDISLDEISEEVENEETPTQTKKFNPFDLMK